MKVPEEKVLERTKVNKLFCKKLPTRIYFSDIHEYDCLMCMPPIQAEING